nr:putative phosphoserine phosphatase [Quercus suber]
MATSATPCAIILLIFATESKPESAWQDLLSELSSIPDLKSIEIGSEVKSAQHRFLDLQQRVAELKLTIDAATPLTLPQCKTISRHPRLQLIEQRDHVEIIIQPAILYEGHRYPGLAVFDMDSTLIQQEVIDELARAVGLYDRVAAITEAAMRGEAPYTDFEASLRARVALLEGVPTSIWQKLRSDGTITFTPGARSLVRVLRARGWKTAVLSGGFTPLAEWVRETLQLDYVHANHLATDDQKGILTGDLVSGKPIVHAEKKRELLLALAAETQISHEHTIAIGDGSNDLLMMGASGLGIAFNAKERVQIAAPIRRNGNSLIDVAFILGITEAEVKSILDAEEIL